VLLILTLWLLFPYLRAFGDIGAGPDNAPSRLYALPEEIRIGEEMSPEDLARQLDAQGYRSWDEDVLPAGRYHFGDDVLVVMRRRHETPQGAVPGQLVVVHFHAGSIAALSADGRPAESAALD